MSVLFNAVPSTHHTFCDRRVGTPPMWGDHRREEAAAPAHQIQHLGRETMILNRSVLSGCWRHHRFIPKLKVLFHVANGFTAFRFVTNLTFHFLSGQLDLLVFNQKCNCDDFPTGSFSMPGADAGVIM